MLALVGQPKNWGRIRATRCVTDIRREARGVVDRFLLRRNHHSMASSSTCARHLRLRSLNYASGALNNAAACVYFCFSGSCFAASSLGWANRGWGARSSCIFGGREVRLRCGPQVAEAKWAGVLTQTLRESTKTGAPGKLAADYGVSDAV